MKRAFACDLRQLYRSAVNPNLGPFEEGEFYIYLRERVYRR